MAKRKAKTVKRPPHVRIYFLRKSAKGKEEGIIRFCVWNGKRYVSDPRQVEEHFDYVAHIPGKIWRLFKRKKVKWP